MGKVVSFFSCCFNGFLSFTNSQLENFLTVITDWDAGNAHSRLEDGMKYSNGRLIVPQDGEYYVYAQLYFRSRGRGSFARITTKLSPCFNIPTTHQMDSTMQGERFILRLMTP